MQVIRGAAAALHVEARAVGLQREDDATGEGLLSIGDVNGDGRDDVMIVASPSVGYRRTLALHLGAKAGLQPRPLATYTMGPRDRVPRDERQGGLP